MPLVFKLLPKVLKVTDNSNRTYSITFKILNKMATINDACYVANIALAAATGGNEPGMSLPTANAKTFNALVASQNRAAARSGGIKITPVAGKQTPQSGTNRALTVEYYNNGCDDTIIDLDGCYDVTSAAVTVGPGTALTDNIYLSKNIGMQFVIKECDFLDSCDTVTRALQAKLTKFRQAALKKVNNETIAHLAANAGNYWTNDGTAVVDSKTNPRSLKLFKTDNTTPQPEGWYPLDAQMGLQGATSYTFVGQSKTDAYAKIKGLYRGNVDGADDAKAAAIAANISSDVNIGLVTEETDDAIVWIDGYVHFVPKVDFVNEIRTDVRRSYSQELAPGLPIDVTVYRDDSKKFPQYIYTFQVDYGFWNVPDEFFAETCLEYHNGILLYKEACADAVCADLIQY